jgi:hypothetical protein
MGPMAPSTEPAILCRTFDPHVKGSGYFPCQMNITTYGADGPFHRTTNIMQHFDPQVKSSWYVLCRINIATYGADGPFHGTTNTMQNFWSTGQKFWVFPVPNEYHHLWGRWPLPQNHQYYAELLFHRSKVLGISLAK